MTHKERAALVVRTRPHTCLSTECDVCISDIATAIELAVKKERKRCAKVAESFVVEAKHRNQHLRNSVSQTIAAAIRRGE